MPDAAAMPDLTTSPRSRDQRDSAELKGTIGIAMMITGGAVLAGGATWALVFNRPRLVVPTVEVAPSGATIGASWSW